MEIIIANLSSGKPAKRVNVNGRWFLIAPMTLIVPGVLNGSQGALYYPPDECHTSVPSWNGMPLTLWHPVVRGNHVSARTPGIIEKYGLGNVYNTSMNGKLTSKGWFDEIHVKNADKRFGTDIHGKLMRGEPIELSTGLYTDNHPAPAGANHNGKAYDFTARNYRPDHVAILPDQIGACSVNDGCGIHVNSADPQCPT